jgi:hypothetical protein
VIPRATKVIAVTAGLSPITHPKRLANSPTTAVTIPMNIRESTKEDFPLLYLAGGISAKNTFHPMEMKCMKASNPEISSTSPSSFIYGASMQAVLN